MVREQLTPVSSEATSWRDWLSENFASYTTADFAQRHIDFWDWAASITSESTPRPFIACWPRGGAKSTTVELACAWIGSQARPARNYVLYVSETQDQADKHVSAISAMLERVGITRAENQYGSSKGWKRTEVRASNGFNITSMGLDTAMRGIKLDEFRPDMIVFDDIDGKHDTANRVQKKIDSITTSILPAEATKGAAIVVVQNMIHEFGIMAGLVNGTADFLHTRLPAVVEPAIQDLEYERRIKPDGGTEYVITGGTPTWPGQSIEICQRQINSWGLIAFLSEAQHDVAAREGGMFKRFWWRFWQPVGARLAPIPIRLSDGTAYEVNAVELPTVWDRSAQSWDMTFKGENRQSETKRKNRKLSYVVGIVAARYKANSYILDLHRERLEFTGTLRAVRNMTDRYPRVGAKLIEDKANGPAVIDVLRNEISGIIPVGVEGSKESRASGATPRVEAGNWFLPHPDIAPWVEDFIRELATFPEGTYDDQVDAFSQVDRYLYGGVSGSISDDLAEAIGAEYQGYT